MFIEIPIILLFIAYIVDDYLKTHPQDIDEEGQMFSDLNDSQN